MIFSNIDILMPDNTILENAYAVTENDIIKYIGKEKPHFGKHKIYNGENKLLIPGLINTHCHVPMTALRGLGNDLPLDKWLETSIFPAEAKLNSEVIYNAALLGIGEMLKSGVTSFCDMYYDCGMIAKAVLESGITANISHSISVFDDAEPYNLPTVKTAEKIFREFNGLENNRLKVNMCLHSEYTTNKKTVKYVSHLAEKYNTSILLHLSETLNEVTNCIKRNGVTPVKYFNNLGVFENNTIAAHCVHVTQDDIEILAKNNVTVSHCPVSNMKLGSGFADIVKLKDNGVNVALGTDGTASNDNLYILEDLKFAALLQKGLHNNPAILRTSEILDMVTKNGAKAMQRDDTGIIKEGYMADLAVIDYNSPNLTPCTDKQSALIYSATTENVVLTMCRGKVVYQNNEFKTIDMEKVLNEVRKFKI